MATETYGNRNKWKAVFRPHNTMRLDKPLYSVEHEYSIKRFIRIIRTERTERNGQTKHSGKFTFSLNSNKFLFCTEKDSVKFATKASVTESKEKKTNEQIHE